MKVAILNNDNSFSHIEEAQLVKTFDVDGKTLIDTYSIGGIFVDILPNIEYDSELEKLVFNFEDNQWIKQDIEISGEFYLKIDGSHHISILKKDSDLYTEIAPIINDGDSVVFSEDKQEWEYTAKGILTLEKDLIAKKQSVINECTAFYENLRQFKVIAGESSLTIIANESVSSNIKTWIGAMKNKIRLGDFYSKDDAYYEYLGFKIPYTKCINLQQHIDYIRTQVVSARDYHTGNAFGVIGEINKIQTTKELESYDYKVNNAGQLMKPFDPIVL